VRQAIAYGIDKDEIVDVVLFGLGSSATGPYVPNTWPYNPNVKKYDYNPERAKQLLRKQAGVDSDGDGILDKDAGRSNSTILTNAGNNLRKKHCHDHPVAAREDRDQGSISGLSNGRPSSISSSTRSGSRPCSSGVP